MRLKAGIFTSVLMLLAIGCKQTEMFLKPEQQHVIDRSVVNYPSNFDLTLFAQTLNCPTALCLDPDGTLFIAEGGIDNIPPHIFGRRVDGSLLEIYPVGKKLPWAKPKFQIFGPIGGIAAANGKVFVSHRDINDMGVITAFGYDGSHTTIVDGLPAQGDYGVTDIAVRPSDGRLFFGVGSATNSGVVGLDNWMAGWLHKHPQACDLSPFDLKLYGSKFKSPNPMAGLFGGGNDRAFTAAFQPFNTDDYLRIQHAADGKANSAIYSISQDGDKLDMEVSGIHLPRGLGFSEFYFFATNDGMELRGTRPIKDDPDALIRIVSGSWLGFPDFSSDMTPISDQRFQPPASVMNYGYPENSELIDKDASNSPNKLTPPDPSQLLKGVFPPQSGAAKFDFLPNTAAYRRYNGAAVVALSGDRAPFSTSGQPLDTPAGCKVVLVDITQKQMQPAKDFIYNALGQPASKLGNSSALERPCDVKLNALDGSLLILDMGQVQMIGGKEKVTPHTGRIFKLTPVAENSSASH